MGSIHIPAIELLGSAVIRILAGYLLFYALTRLASRAAVRHILWLLFLAASSCYWVNAVQGMMKAQPVTSLASSTAALASSAAIRSRNVTTLTIPRTWNWSIAPTLAFLFWIYAAGAAAMLVRIARRRVRLREAVSQARLAAPELEAVFRTVPPPGDFAVPDSAGVAGAEFARNGIRVESGGDHARRPRCCSGL